MNITFFYKICYNIYTLRDIIISAVYHKQMVKNVPSTFWCCRPYINICRG